MSPGPQMASFRDSDLPAVAPMQCRPLFYQSKPFGGSGPHRCLNVCNAPRFCAAAGSEARIG